MTSVPLKLPKQAGHADDDYDKCPAKTTKTNLTDLSLTETMHLASYIVTTKMVMTIPKVRQIMR